ncbi:MAG: UDP-N-acetylmuramoyl-tripeptide--D-alanyl-D-alanine ligase [Pontiellaceae bacterium]|nr:UDP-N-acetylmuramoyl-tripeptide--D-alanyl-D-alanine ligase [Pontiellaceae bacterium]
MICFSPEEMAQWAGSVWSGTVPPPIRGVSHDTRTLKLGDLYIALRGDRFDGHDFVAQAFEKGAAGALVQDDFFSVGDYPLLKVSDTLKGLQDSARGYRETWTGTVVGVTGSVGKTTLKEMCAEVLSQKGWVHRTPGNLNNHIGLPLSMLSMPRTAAYGVFEIGMSHPGEIAALAENLRPTIAIMSDICNAHRESFDSLEAIAREKAALLTALPSSGLAILDRDSEWHDLMRAQTSARTVSISFGGAGDYVGSKVGDSFLEVNGFKYTMPLPGHHIMRNALRAIALGLELGEEPSAIADGLSRFKNPPMRWEEHRINGVHFVNDAYNANPLSMRAGLKTFAELKGTGKKWVVLGGMRELGAAEPEEHAVLGRVVDELNFDGVVAVGALAAQIRCPQTERIYYCAETAEAAQILKNNLRTDDRVLLKASRGERLERVLECFKEM